MQNEEFAERMREQHAEGVTTGPVARLKQIAKRHNLTALGTEMLRGFDDQDAVQEWLHRVRAHWKKRQWQQVKKRRGEDFTGIENGIDERTTALLYALESGSKQYAELLQLPAVQALGERESEEARKLLSVLRRIFVGNVLVAEREYRHASEAKKARQPHLTDKCKCRELRDGQYMTPKATVEHVLWHCNLGEELRADAMRVLESCGMGVADLPRCFRYALLWPDQWQAPQGTRAPTEHEIARIQIAIAKVLQRHWHGEDSDDDSDDEDEEEESDDDNDDQGGDEQEEQVESKRRKAKPKRAKVSVKKAADADKTKGLTAIDGPRGHPDGDSDIDMSEKRKKGKAPKLHSVTKRRLKAKGHDVKFRAGLWRCLNCGMFAKHQASLSRWGESDCDKSLQDAMLKDADWLAGAAKGAKHPRYINRMTNKVTEKLNIGTGEFKKHKIFWNGQLGSSFFEDNAGWLHCEKCEAAWHWSYASSMNDVNECRQSPEYWRTARARNLLAMRKWNEVQNAAKVKWGAHKVEYSEDKNIWRCFGCRTWGKYVMSEGFLKVMQQPCKYEQQPKGTLHVQGSGMLQSTHKKTKLDKKKLKTQGVTPVKGEDHDWYDAEFVKAELQRMAAHRGAVT